MEQKIVRIKPNQWVWVCQRCPEHVLEMINIRPGGDPEADNLWVRARMLEKIGRMDCQQEK